LRVFGYLKHNAKSRILFDPSEMDLSKVEFESHDWRDLYPHAQETIGEDVPRPMTCKVQITAYVDASHATDMQTRRSVTGYMLFVGKTPVKWYSKRQNTVESSTYGSELVAMRIAVEAVLELRYKLRMMGINIEDTTNVLTDNQAIVFNTQFPSSNLKKKHNAVAYHKCREAVAAGIIRTGHIRSEDNVSDILTKPLGGQAYYRLLRGHMYGRYTGEDTLSMCPKGSSRNSSVTDGNKPRDRDIPASTGLRVEHTPKSGKGTRATPG